MEASPSLSAFEVERAGGVAAAEEEGGGDGGDCSVCAAAGARAAAEAGGAGSGVTIWLAGHVEAFNIPGTNTEVGGVRFLESCYQWQLHSSAS